MTALLLSLSGGGTFFPFTGQPLSPLSRPNGTFPSLLSLSFSPDNTILPAPFPGLSPSQKHRPKHRENTIRNTPRPPNKHPREIPPKGKSRRKIPVKNKIFALFTRKIPFPRPYIYPGDIPGSPWYHSPRPRIPVPMTASSRGTAGAFLPPGRPSRGLLSLFSTYSKPIFSLFK